MLIALGQAVDHGRARARGCSTCRSAGDAAAARRAAVVVGTAGWFFFYAIFALRIRRNDAFNTVTSIFYFVFLFASSMFYPLEPLPARSARSAREPDHLARRRAALRDGRRRRGVAIALEAAAFVAFTVAAFRERALGAEPRAVAPPVASGLSCADVGAGQTWSACMRTLAGTGVTLCVDTAAAGGNSGERFNRPVRAPSRPPGSPSSGDRAPFDRPRYNSISAMNPILRDMFAHQFWADAELWNAFGAHPPAREDKALRDRLHHIHLVQRAFFWGVGGGATPFEFHEARGLRDVRRSAHVRARKSRRDPRGPRRSHRHAPFRADPDSVVQDPPLTITITEALTQCAMHSHHHRGQNATRLRELGGAPPSTDLIVWYWKGRPQPSWT